MNKSNRTAGNEAASSAMHAACDADEGGQGRLCGGAKGYSPQVGALAEDGGGCGRRVRDDAVVGWVPPQGGKKRGRPPNAANAVDLNTAARKRQKSHTRKRLRWTDVGREEFNRVQKTARMEAGSNVALSRNEWTQQFGRGEGGGVT